MTLMFDDVLMIIFNRMIEFRKRWISKLNTLVIGSIVLIVHIEMFSLMFVYRLSCMNLLNLTGFESILSVY